MTCSIYIPSCACAIVAAQSVLGRVFALEIEVHEGALDFFHLLYAIL
jgi:hypothetical protein